MALLYSCSQCGALFPRIDRRTRCNTCAPYGWPADRPRMSSNWTQIRKSWLLAHPYCVTPTHPKRRAVTVDHIQARAFGGTDDPSNLQPLCGPCAKRKDHEDREKGKGRH